MSNSPNGSNHSSSGRENPSGYMNASRLKRRNSRESPMAFYEIPAWVENVPTKIINDAKQSLREIPTSRPFTPRDDSRYTLTKLNYEPAIFNAASVDYEVESRPASGRPVDIKRRHSKGPVDVPVPPAAASSRLSKLNDKANERIKHSNEKSNDSVQAKPPLPTSPPSSATSGTSSAKTSSSSRSSHRIHSAAAKEEAAEDNQVWEQEIDSLVAILVDSYRKKDYSQFNRTSHNLYDTLSEKNLFGKKSNKKRSSLLKTLFGFIESENPIVRFHVARISLAFQITNTNNLRNIIRLTADLSSNKDNDHYFQTTNLIDLILETISRIDVVSNLESISYFCTTIKNLTVNNELICLITEKKPFPLLKTILKCLLDLKDKQELLNHLCDCLTPLTDALRNLAENDVNRREFLSDDLIVHLTLVLKYFTDKSHGDLMKNVARIFSKLTQHTDCCMKLVQCSTSYRSFVKILAKHESNQPLVVRVCFVLGNVMARSEDARLMFMKDSYALQTLTKLLQSYIQLDSLVLKPEKLENDDSTSQDADVIDDPNMTQFRSIENVINKIIRVLSNLAISQENGLIIIRRDDCIDLLFKLLKQPSQHSEELLVHVLMALNNLSYYDDPQSYIVRHADTLTQLLVKYIRNEEKMDCVVEAFRVLGNLSRTHRIRDILMACKVDRLAIYHCQSNNIELLYAVIGVLINLTVDEDKRECLKLNNGIDSLINIFEYSIHSDWQLSSLVCKALWNYCDNNYEKLKSLPLWFTEEQLKILLDIFNETLNESDLQPTDDEQLDELNKQLWNEEYFPVGSRLYQRLIEGNEHFKTVKINDYS